MGGPLYLVSCAANDQADGNERKLFVSHNCHMLLHRIRGRFGRAFDVYGNYDLALNVAIAGLAVGTIFIATLGKPPKFS